MQGTLQFHLLPTPIEGAIQWKDCQCIPIRIVNGDFRPEVASQFVNIYIFNRSELIAVTAIGSGSGGDAAVHVLKTVIGGIDYEALRFCIVMMGSHGGLQGELAVFVPKAYHLIAFIPDDSRVFVA